MMNKKSANFGFTLIEMMIVVAIIGIIAAIAYPSYQQHVIRSNRAVANVCLVELSQFMERYYTTNMTYLDANGNAIALPGCGGNAAQFYAFAFNGAPTVNTYSIQATPIGAQLNDSCGTLSLDQAGVRSPVDAHCWK